MLKGFYKYFGQNFEKIWTDVGWILDGFLRGVCKDLGRIFVALSKDFRRVWEGCWKDFGKVLGLFWEGFWNDLQGRAFVRNLIQIATTPGDGPRRLGFDWDGPTSLACPGRYFASNLLPNSFRDPSEILPKSLPKSFQNPSKIDKKNKKNR